MIHSLLSANCRGGSPIRSSLMNRSGISVCARKSLGVVQSSSTDEVSCTHTPHACVRSSAKVIHPGRARRRGQGEGKEKGRR